MSSFGAIAFNKCFYGPLNPFFKFIVVGDIQSPEKTLENARLAQSFEMHGNYLGFTLVELICFDQIFNDGHQNRNSSFVTIFIEYSCQLRLPTGFPND